MARKSTIQWRRWNLDYAKRVMAQNPNSQMAQALLGCWSPRIQRALVSRYYSDRKSRTWGRK